MYHPTVGDIWIWLDPPEKQFILRLLAPAHPRIHLAQLALMRIDRVLKAISKHHRVDQPTPGIHMICMAGAHIPGRVQWLPGNVMPIWMKLYDEGERVKAKRKEANNDRRVELPDSTG